MQVKNKREFLSLLFLRHIAFAELSKAITAKIARAMLYVRPIIYRARQSAVARRTPHAAARTWALAHHTRRPSAPAPPSAVPTATGRDLASAPAPHRRPKLGARSGESANKL
jgi:hypothetical protein